MNKFKTQVKGRKISSQMTGYEVIEEFEFIITLIVEGHRKQFFRGPHRVQIVGRWYKTPAEAKKKAIEAAKLLGIRLDWRKA